MYNSNSFILHATVSLSIELGNSYYILHVFVQKFPFQISYFFGPKRRTNRIYVTVIITHAMDAIVDDLPHPHSVALKLVRCSWYSLKWSYLVEI